MKGKKKRITSLGMAVLLGVMVLFPGIDVKARAGMGFIDVKKNFKQTITCSKSDKKNGYLFGTYNVLPQNAKKMKIVSSKKSVAVIEKEQNNIFILMPKKTGTTKITVTAVVGKKKVTYIGTVKIIDFHNPFKSLKINGKNRLKEVGGYTNFIEMKAQKVKLDYKLNSGWKVTETQVTGFHQNTVKNNKTYTKKGQEVSAIYITVKNKKSGEEITLSIVVS